MKNVYTVVGRPYAVTTSALCTVTTPEGVVIATCEPGCQMIFVAPCDVVIVSHDDAHVTETFNSAASAVSGGGALSKHARNEELHLRSGERNKWNAMLPVGTILPSACSSLAGFLLCNGAAVRRTSYASLFAAIGTRFGAGDGSSTFNLPDVRGRTLWGADSSAPLGTVLAAGLPNVTGEFCAYAYDTGQATGAFASTVQAESVLNSGTQVGYNRQKFTISASRSNSIYGGASTVQPPALAINCFIKY